MKTLLLILLLLLTGCAECIEQHDVCQHLTAYMLPMWINGNLMYQTHYIRDDVACDSDTHNHNETVCTRWQE